MNIKKALEYMVVTQVNNQIIVVECADADEHRLPEPLHRLDYQTGALRLELANDDVTRVALRLCGVTVPPTDPGITP